MKRTRTRRPAPTAPVAAKPQARISESALAILLAGTAKPEVHPYELPKVAPGVLPAGKTGMAMDDSSLTSLYAWAAQASYAEGVQFFGYPLLAQMAQRAEYRRPCEIIAKEMTRKWIKLKATGDDDKTQQIEQLQDAVEKFNLQGVLCKAAEVDGLFGRAQIYINTGFDLSDRDEIQTPLSLTAAKIPRGSLKRLTVVEPVWTYPSSYNSTDPLDEHFYRPTSWYVMGAQVHATRLPTIIGRPVPDLLKPAYMFGGLSLTQMMKPYVDNWLNTRQSVADLIHSFTVFTLKTDMNQVLQGGAATDLVNRLKIFNSYRDNRGLMVLNKESEELDNISAPLGTLDSLQAQTQEHMSAVTGIPLSILLGITPHGLNASSEGEIRTFYQWIEAQQEAVLTPVVRYLLKVIQMHLWGAIDPAITFAWEPLWTMSEKERAEIDKTNAEADDIRIGNGTLTAHEARVRLAGEEDSPYAGIDLSQDPVPPAEPDADMDVDPSTAVSNLLARPEEGEGAPRAQA